MASSEGSTLWTVTSTSTASSVLESKSGVSREIASVILNQRSPQSFPLQTKTAIDVVNRFQTCIAFLEHPRRKFTKWVFKGTWYRLGFWRQLATWPQFFYSFRRFKTTLRSASEMGLQLPSMPWRINPHLRLWSSGLFALLLISAAYSRARHYLIIRWVFIHHSATTACFETIDRMCSIYTAC